MVVFIHITTITTIVFTLMCRYVCIYLYLNVYYDCVTHILTNGYLSRSTSVGITLVMHVYAHSITHAHTYICDSHYIVTQQ
jgi:hypothetical protein